MISTLLYYIMWGNTYSNLRLLAFAVCELIELVIAFIILEGRGE